MRINHSIALAFKTILFFVIGVLLTFTRNNPDHTIIGILLVFSGSLSAIFAYQNQQIILISLRNYFNGFTEILTGVSLFFISMLSITNTTLLAMFFIALAFGQIGFALYSGYKWVRTNNFITLFRIFIPLFGIIPSGLILGSLMTKGLEVSLIALLFFVVGILNFYYILHGQDIEYTESGMTDWI